MPSILPEVDFQRIRICRGTQHGGFEELSVSLFRAEVGDPFQESRAVAVIMALKHSFGARTTTLSGFSPNTFGN